MYFVLEQKSIGFSLGYEIFSAPKKSNYMVQKEGK